MRLADMRTWVRRRIFDTEKQVFPDDGFIDSALNVAAQNGVQAKVMEVAPDAFEAEYVRNLEANKFKYQLPRGFLTEKQVFVNGVELAPGMARDIRTGFYGDDPHYAVSAPNLLISPCPASNREDALKLVYVPALVLADDDDDLEDQGLASPLHMAVVLWAAKLLLPEGGEDNTKIDAEILSLLAKIPAIYGYRNSGAPLNVGGLGKEL